ncbi:MULTISPECIES: MobA/MobL family protein [unclassified Psychrobacter]|uniref:MobA/MobL family protein n=2 Tax=Psychrobacter TaxID=497 RepID=UPI0025B42D3D|nr:MULTISPECIES: MobA/MobL family protein [unclassified Psychrobacter]MDN3454130.1 MobA/MobL family protein [Psychrobacter sp. APC 3350]MDN3503650.1 MobA/MobL family protein [Psychrobacter sp. 5A.1]
MTMVHIATKAISRKAGQSAVASAAYRAGDVLDDAKYGKTHDYSKKSGVMSSDIVLPFSLKALGVSVDRETLWNTAEAAETRSDSRVAREWLINLPHELSEEERHSLAINFAQKLCDDMDVIADVCIHRPVMKLPFDPNVPPSSKYLREGEENPDPRNFHAHILVTTRAPTVGPNKTLAFDPKLKTPFEWSNKKRKAHDLPSSMQEIKRIREMWVDTANKVLAEYHLPLMDARSYKDQGLDQQPTIKMGVEATAMERRGITTEKGNTNRAIKARNNLVAENHIKQEADNERRISALRKGLAWATEKNARLPGSIGGTKQRADFAKQLSGSSEPHITYCTEQSNRTAVRVDDTKRCIEDAKSGIAWAAKRCENLPKRCDDTKQAIEGITEAIGKSNIEINKATERSARPAPNPFDDAARRARAARLDRQEGRIDRDTRANRFEDERIFEYAERMKLHLAMRLIQRHREAMAINWAQGETAADAPDKFDQRQVALLSDFAQRHGIEDHDKAVEFTAHLRQVAKRFDHTLVENNKAIIKLLRDPNAEREQYLALTKHFTDFRDNIDQKRAAFNTSIIDKLGGSAGEVGRMTRDIISSSSYIEGLNHYINNDSHSVEARDVAKEYLADTLDKTCQQFKLALRDVNSLPPTQRKTYSEALKATLETFTEQYGKELSESQYKALQGGLESYQYQVNKAHSPSRGFSP